MRLNIDDRCFFDILYGRYRFTRALTVDHEIASHAIEPCTDLCAVGLPCQGFFCEPQQRFLGDILRLDPVAQPVPGKCRDRGKMTVGERRPGGLIPPDGTPYQLVIRNIAQIVGHDLYTRPFGIWVSGDCGIRVRPG